MVSFYEAFILRRRADGRVYALGREWRVSMLSVLISMT